MLQILMHIVMRITVIKFSRWEAQLMILLTYALLKNLTSMGVLEKLDIIQYW